MATTETIGTGGTRSTIAAWEALVPNPPTGGYIGACLNEVHTINGVVIGGHTTSATDFIKLTANTGASFQDNANVRSNALYYNTSNGAACLQTGSLSIGIDVQDDYVTIDRLQFRLTSGTYGSPILKFPTAGHGLLKDCIIFKDVSANLTLVNLQCNKIVNCVIHNSGSTVGTMLSLYDYYGTKGYAINCTFVNTASAGGTAISNSGTSSNDNSLTNCAIFNFTTAVTNSGSATGDYNATNLSSGVPGANSLTSLTASNELESTTTDFRIKSTSNLKDAGNTDSNYPNDISGTARGTTTDGDIGAWEIASSGISVSPSAGALTLTGVAPTVKTARNISPSAGALTITGVAPTVSVTPAGVSVSVSAGALTLTGVAPTVKTDFRITPAAGTLAITGVAPTLKTDQTVSVSAGALTITGYAPTVKQGVSISPAAGALAVTGIAPTVTEQIKVTPDAGTLTITGVAPSVFVAAPGTFAPGYATLTLTGVAPTVTQQEKLSVPAGSLTIAGVAPSVSVGTSISVGAGALEITGVAPTVTTNHNIVVGAAELTLAGYAPVITSPLNFLIDPAQIVITGYAPTVAGGVSEAVADKGAGSGRKKPSRRRRKPVLVEIDGESFVVNSEAEAVELVDKAREAAEEKARSQAELILKKRQAKNAKDGRLNTQPIRLDEPQISVRPVDDGRIDQAWISEVDRLVNESISNAYEAVARDFETRLLIEYGLAVDEEETLVALLLTI